MNTIGKFVTGAVLLALLLSIGIWIKWSAWKRGHVIFALAGEQFEYRIRECPTERSLLGMLLDTSDGSYVFEVIEPRINRPTTSFATYWDSYEIEA
jgi:hypothetical protein